MALPNAFGANGATPATDQTVIDAELAEWVYHRAEKDQGLALNEIETGALIYNGARTSFQSNLTSQGYTIGPEGFIYNKATGFCCAVVNDAGGYAIVVRGTDVGGLASTIKAFADSFAGLPSQTRGTTDELDVYQDIAQGRGSLAPTQSQDVLNVIAALKSAHLTPAFVLSDNHLEEGMPPSQRSSPGSTLMCSIPPPLRRS